MTPDAVVSGVVWLGRHRFNPLGARKLAVYASSDAAEVCRGQVWWMYRGAVRAAKMARDEGAALVYASAHRFAVISEAWGIGAWEIDQHAGLIEPTMTPGQALRMFAWRTYFGAHLFALNARTVAELDKRWGLAADHLLMSQILSHLGDELVAEAGRHDRRAAGAGMVT